MIPWHIVGSSSYNKFDDQWIIPWANQIFWSLWAFKAFFYYFFYILIVDVKNKF